MVIRLDRPRNRTCRSLTGDWYIEKREFGLVDQNFQRVDQKIAWRRTIDACWEMEYFFTAAKDTPFLAHDSIDSELEAQASEHKTPPIVDSSQ